MGTGLPEDESVREEREEDREAGGSDSGAGLTSTTSEYHLRGDSVIVKD